jgi:hypothetical protein
MGDLWPSIQINARNSVSPKKNQPIQHNYILHNHILESVTSAKYLDITLQQTYDGTYIMTTSFQMETNPLDSWNEI